MYRSHRLSVYDHGFAPYIAFVLRHHDDRDVVSVTLDTVNNIAFHTSSAVMHELFANDKHGLMSAVVHCLPKRRHWDAPSESQNLDKILMVFRAAFRFIELQTKEKPESFADFEFVLQLIDTALSADVTGQCLHTGDADDDWLLDELRISVYTLLERHGKSGNRPRHVCLCSTRRLALMYLYDA